MGGGCSQGYWPCAEPGLPKGPEQAGGRCSARSLVALAPWGVLGEQGSSLAATAVVHSL